MAAKSRPANKIVRQRTLKNSIHCSGIGVHSGVKVSMVLRPAEADSGIVFRRTDPAGRGAEIEALWSNAIETPLCTTLQGPNGVRVATIEHLMSALLGCGVDNAVIELNGGEVPIMDGSAAPFVFLIECAGVVEQRAPRRGLRVLKKVEIREPHRAASLAPASGFSIDFEIDFDNPLVGQQEWFGHLTSESYKEDIARARTFGFLHEIDKLRAMGLARGGSLDNAVVISGEEILNAGGLRYENEFVRHKVLDSIGDLLLAGGTIIGHFSGLRAGHSLTLRLLQKLFAEDGAWEWCKLTEADLVPSVMAPQAAEAALAASA